MRTERQDPTAVRSSIALLQERFRQLERVRKMREGRQLLKKQVESSSNQFNFNPNNSYETKRLVLLPELMVSPSSPSQVSLSLWPSSRSRREDCSAFETPCSMNFRQAADLTPCIHASWNKIGDYDSGVDTSLHL